jgi:hypothetical protein
MDEMLLARAKSAANPFDSNRVDSAWDSEAVDVEGINRTAFEQCLQTVELVRRNGQCRGLLLSGEPGSGKTHLLQRLRRHVQRQGGDCFVYVPPVSGPDRFFRDLLQHTVQDFVVGRTGSQSSQLECVLLRQLLRSETQERVTAAEFWSDLRRRHTPGKTLFRHLEPAMKRLAERVSLDPEIALVLRHYLAEHHRHDAYSWLLGRSVPEATLERLGVSRTLEDDGDALQALTALSSLAGEHSVVVLAFDQLEGLQARPDDQDPLRVFGLGVSKLFVRCRNVATISCVQTYFKQDLERALPPAHMQRLAQDQGALTLLDTSAAIRLVAGRLESEAHLRDARKTLGDADSLWPLDRQDIDAAMTGGGIPARQLLSYCRDRFAAWRLGTPRPEPPPESLDERFAEETDRAAGESPDEGVLADGLLKVIDARAPGQARRGDRRDLDLVVAGIEGDIGVAVCHAQNMTSLAARLKRLQSVGSSASFKRLVILRDERLPISSTATTTRQRLSALQDAGHIFVQSTAEAYAAIAAARRLLAEAAAGDLSLNGQPVAPESLKTWLAGHPDAATTALLDALDVPTSRTEDETLTRLQELLEGQWVARAAEVTLKLGLDEAVLVRSVTTRQRLVGLLVGPPAVLFLRPEAVRHD